MSEFKNKLVFIGTLIPIIIVILASISFITALLCSTINFIGGYKLSFQSFTNCFISSAILYGIILIAYIVCSIIINIIYSCKYGKRFKKLFFRRIREGDSKS